MVNVRLTVTCTPPKAADTARRNSCDSNLLETLAVVHRGTSSDRPGLYCVELRTTRWAELVEWYRNVLGLRVLVRVTDDSYALLEAGETRLALLGRKNSSEPTRRISLAFEVRDLRAVVARLQQENSAVYPPQENPEGLREISTTDPDGNRIRVFSWPKGR